MTSEPGVTLCQLTGAPRAPQLPMKRPHLPVLGGGGTIWWRPGETLLSLQGLSEALTAAVNLILGPAGMQRSRAAGKPFPTSRTSAGSGIACQKSFQADDKFILRSCIPQSTAEMGVNDTSANKFFEIIMQTFQRGMLFTLTQQ